MKHNLSIRVSNRNSSGKIVSCRNVSLREKFMRLLFGDLHKVAILLPGDSVEEVAIRVIYRIIKTRRSIFYGK